MLQLGEYGIISTIMKIRGADYTENIIVLLTIYCTWILNTSDYSWHNMNHSLEDNCTLKSGVLKQYIKKGIHFYRIVFEKKNLGVSLVSF